MRCHRRFSHSLSGRLILLFVGTGLLLLALVGASIGFGLSTRFTATVLPHFIQYLDYLRQDIGSPPDLARAAELTRRLPLGIHIAGPDAEWSSEGNPIDLGRLETDHRVERDGKRYAHGKAGGREFLVLQDGSYTFAFSIPSERNPWRFLIPLTVLFLFLALLYHATRRLFAPIADIKAGVERIGRGELDGRVRIERKDELGDLAESINAMAADVKQMLDSKRQLLLAISHELRSPLTRAKVAVNLVEEPSQRSDVERELNDLERLIEELLETERLALRHQVLNRQAVDLNDLLQEVVDNLRSERRPLLRLPGAAVHAEVDPLRMRLLVRNLLDNALRHTPPVADVPELTLETSAEGVEIAVRDFGSGIAPEHLPHIAEPFYRVDPARRRETGGYGLGLYLCRRIAEVHGGRLVVTSEAGSGTTVRISLPAKAAPNS